MPLVELEFRVKNAPEALEAQSNLEKSLRETEKSATGSTRALNRLEKQMQANVRSAESYRAELARVAREAVAGSDVQLAALRKLRAEEEKIERQRKTGTFSAQFSRGLGSTRLNVGPFSPLLGSFGRGPGQFAGAAVGVLGGLAATGISKGVSSLTGGALSMITSAGQTAINTLSELAHTALQTGVAITAGVVKSAFEGAVELDSLTRGLATVSKNADDLRRKLRVSREIARLPGLGFSESVQGKLQLESAGAPDALATRSLLAFGNALASAGKGKDDLREVNNQLSQMLASGKLQGDEIRVISERVPQLRRAIATAFGTTDVQKINKMGLSAVEVIDKLVTELEKLPRVSGGLRNILDNLSDDTKFALQPLGQGAGILAEGILSGSGAGFAKLSELFRGAGEVLAAVGKSGVAAEAIGKALSPLSGVNVRTFQQALATGAAAVASAFAQVPSVMEIAADYSGIIAFNLKSAGDFLMKALPIAFDFGKGFLSSLGSQVIGNDLGMGQKKKWTESGLMPDGVGSVLTQIVGKFFGADDLGISSILARGGAAGLAYKDKDGKTVGDRLGALEMPMLLSMNPMDYPRLASKIERLIGNPEKGITGSFQRDFESYRQRILSSITALPDVPNGLTFGADGQLTDSTGARADSPLEKLLSRLEGIERKGRMGGADFLRSLTTGEMDSPAFLLTGAEMNRAGARGQYLEPQHYATGLEQELTRLILQILRQNGAGTPALGGAW